MLCCAELRSRQCTPSWPPTPPASASPSSAQQPANRTEWCVPRRRPVLGCCQQCVHAAAAVAAIFLQAGPCGMCFNGSMSLFLHALDPTQPAACHRTAGAVTVSCSCLCAPALRGLLCAATGPSPTQIGMHFMNPVPLMALVELAKGLHTSQQTYEACKGLAEFLGKQVATSQDRPVSRQDTRSVCAACAERGGGEMSVHKSWQGAGWRMKPCVRDRATVTGRLAAVWSPC